MGPRTESKETGLCPDSRCYCVDGIAHEPAIQSYHSHEEVYLKKKNLLNSVEDILG